MLGNEPANVIPAPRGETDTESPPIPRILLPAHEAITLQSPDDTGEVSGRHEKPPSEVRQCGAVGSPVEEREHVELGKSRRVLKGPPDLPADQIVRLQKMEPQRSRTALSQVGLRVLGTTSRAQVPACRSACEARRLPRRCGHRRPRGDRSRHASGLRPLQRGSGPHAPARPQEIRPRQTGVSSVRPGETLLEARHSAAVPSISTLAPSSRRAAT